MRVGWLIGVRKSSITQWLNLLLYLEGKGLEITSVDVKCMADALSKQRYVGLACGTWCFPCLGARIFRSLCYQSINHDFLMGTGRRDIGLKSTPQSFSPLLSRNSKNGFLLWGKNTLFQFPLVFLPWDSQFPSILTSWDPDKWAEKIIHSSHILTNSFCIQRCLERAERKWPSRTGFWPLVLWVAREVHSLALALHGDHESHEAQANTIYNIRWRNTGVPIWSKHALCDTGHAQGKQRREHHHERFVCSWESGGQFPAVHLEWKVE